MPRIFLDEGLEHGHEILLHGIDHAHHARGEQPLIGLGHLRGFDHRERSRAHALRELDDGLFDFLFLGVVHCDFLSARGLVGFRVTEVLPIVEAGKFAPAVDIHIEEMHTLLCIRILPTVAHHLSDGERFGLELEDLDCFVADHVRIIPSRGSVVHQNLEIFARTQVAFVKALTLARARAFFLLAREVETREHNKQDACDEDDGLDGASARDHVYIIGGARYRIKRKPENLFVVSACR